MRGVVALAAALALPENLPDGTPFPQRDLIIFLTLASSRNARLARVDFAPANFAPSVSSVRLELKTKKTRAAGSSPAPR